MFFIPRLHLKHHALASIVLRHAVLTRLIERIERVGVVAGAALEVIASHSVLGLQMANDRLDRGAELHLAADRAGHPPHLAGDPDAEFVGRLQPR
jgi:hypothetical protein